MIFPETFGAYSFNPVDSYIWFELYGSPTDRDVDLIGSVSKWLFPSSVPSVY